ncbi:Malate:quinone oxidoreductase [candidate division SR1 bacterium Aalborg_AAW-1]|nr:Malate:quinone oxidoreductase [candidate division SR1 bacterium Aalborg_AAW-1]
MKSQEQYNIILVGAGIMSATLATLLSELNPEYKIAIIERLDEMAQESSAAMNNAGTGHSAFCELNYTPQDKDGNISIAKAISIAEQFEISKQFWSSLVEKNSIADPSCFISQIPHSSLVFGEENVQYLKKRYQAMIHSPLFSDMQYSEDHEEIIKWMPLVMKGRDMSERIAATRMEIGTDVNFGALTKLMIDNLVQRQNVTLLLGKEVKDLTQLDDKSWSVEVGSTHGSNDHKTLTTKLIFLGAGGGALPLLQRSGIEERKQFGGFPVSGQWLICTNPDIVAQHEAKVYGKAALGAPPMSVPHLDTRMIDGKKALLFGPYAGFTTKYLKKGSFFDLFGSLRLYNIWTMLQAGARNLGLTKYLIEQVVQSSSTRFKALQEYMPSAEPKDWELIEAGYRVQVIKNDPKQGGILQFGTEVVVSEDKSLSTLLGASPGASTAVSVMINIIEQCFPQFIGKLPELIPSYGKALYQDTTLLKNMRDWTGKILKIHY